MDAPQAVCAANDALARVLHALPRINAAADECSVLAAGLVRRTRLVGTAASGAAVLRAAADYAARTDAFLQSLSATKRAGIAALHDLCAAFEKLRREEDCASARLLYPDAAAAVDSAHSTLEAMLAAAERPHASAVLDARLLFHVQVRACALMLGMPKSECDSQLCAAVEPEVRSAVAAAVAACAALDYPHAARVARAAELGVHLAQWLAERLADPHAARLAAAVALGAARDAACAAALEFCAAADARPPAGDVRTTDLFAAEGAMILQAARERLVFPASDWSAIFAHDSTLLGVFGDALRRTARTYVRLEAEYARGAAALAMQIAPPAGPQTHWASAGVEDAAFVVRKVASRCAETHVSPAELSSAACNAFRAAVEGRVWRPGNAPRDLVVAANDGFAAAQCLENVAAHVSHLLHVMSESDDSGTPVVAQLFCSLEEDARDKASHSGTGNATSNLSDRLIDADPSSGHARALREMHDKTAQDIAAPLAELALACRQAAHNAVVRLYSQHVRPKLLSVLNGPGARTVDGAAQALESFASLELSTRPAVSSPTTICRGAHRILVSLASEDACDCIERLITCTKNIPDVTQLEETLQAIGRANATMLGTLTRIDALLRSRFGAEIQTGMAAEHCVSEVSDDGKDLV